RRARIEHAAHGHLLQSPPRRESRCERVGHDSGAHRGDGDRNLGRVDAISTAAAGARLAARRCVQPLNLVSSMTRIVLGFDVGGSSVKAGLVDVDGGRMLGDLTSAPTPQPATPQAVMSVIAALASRLPGSTGRIGVALPSVVKQGIVRTAANIDHSWIGTN